MFVVRSSLARVVSGLCLSSALVACTVDGGDGGDDSGAADTMMLDLPTSNTAVRIALFGEGNKAPASADSLRVWPAWVIVASDDEFVIELAGDAAATTTLTLNGEAFPTVDLEFGAPPAEAMIDEDDGGRFAQPMALVLDESVDATTLGRFGALAPTASLGYSTYLGFVPEGGLSASLRERGFAEGLNDQTTDADGEPSQVAFVAVATAAAQFESLASVADIIVR